MGTVVNAGRWRGYPDLTCTEISRFSTRRLHKPHSHWIAATSPDDLKVRGNATLCRGSRVTHGSDPHPATRATMPTNQSAIRTFVIVSRW